MSQNLEKLLNGKFYIHQGYAMALVPTLIKMLSSVTIVERPESEIQASLTSIHSPKADSGSVSSSDLKNVAIINFHQPVMKYSDGWQWLGTQSYIRILESLKHDDSIAGVVMSVDSGGGQVYGTPEFYDYIIDFCAVKPLVIYTGGLLCSGAYYFSAGASWIVANKRADAIGSIGVYTILVDYTGFYEKYGVKFHEIYSSLSDDKNKAHRDVMSGKDVDYKNYIKLELDPIAEGFIADMKAVRPQIKEEAFKGGVWTGAQAVEMGLVDENGTLETAIAKVYELSNVSNSNSNKNNSKSKKKSMSKKTQKFSAIQGIIGIEGDGIATISTVLGNKGVQLTEAHLEKLENALAEKDASIAKATSRISAIKTAADTAIKTAGLETEAAEAKTTSAKITLLGAKVVEYGKKPGAKVTTPKAKGDSFEEADDEMSTSIFDGI